MLSIPKQVKKDLFDLIVKQSDPFSTRGDEGYIPFLESIWPLRNMPSRDPRFHDAYGDVYQHTINNNDWEEEYIFLDRFELLEDDTNYNKFLNVLVSPKFRNGTDDIKRFVLLIDPYLIKYGYKFDLKQYNNEDLPVYEITNLLDIEDRPADIPLNNMPIYVNDNPIGFGDRVGSVVIPETTPALILNFNTGWNDFGIHSTFYLFYVDAEATINQIGEVKIIKRDGGNDISKVLENEFTSLPNGFCSLGQSSNYYKNLKSSFEKDYETILYALKDAAFFSDIQDAFEKNDHFKTSLLRTDSAERLLRTARYVTHDFDLRNLFAFKYNFKFPYAEEPIDIDFSFNSELDIANKGRIYALIGKNGAGKTQLITSLPLSIAEKDITTFMPQIPFFSKVIAVSYSVFDQFQIPSKSASFNYVYCGLRKNENEDLSDKGQLLRFRTSCERVMNLGRVEKLKKVLLNFIEPSVVERLIVFNQSGNPDIASRWIIDQNAFKELRSKLSSGQSIILFIITQIVANIRYDSLLLYDEPETHLHPNAVTELMNTIYELVHEFQSYCIIATHSPIVIRELFSQNVYVVEKHETVPSVRRIGKECFGESIDVLIDEIFGNREVPKYYKTLIDEMAVLGSTYDQIIERLEFGDVPLGLKVKLYIQNKTSANA